MLCWSPIWLVTHFINHQSACRAPPRCGHPTTTSAFSTLCLPLQLDFDALYSLAALREEQLGDMAVSSTRSSAAGATVAVAAADSAVCTASPKTSASGLMSSLFSRRSVAPGSDADLQQHQPAAAPEIIPVSKMCLEAATLLVHLVRTLVNEVRFLL